MIRNIYILLLLSLSFGTVTDIDGNVYETVQIGEQLWMAENLKVTHYKNGDEIPYPSDEDFGSWDEGQYGIYDNDSTNADIYGNLYNWFVVYDDRGVCLEGWHVPSDEEYTILIDYLGGQFVVGGQMKSTGTIESGDGLWYSPNVGATNESGFSGLPAGYRHSIGAYHNMGTDGYFWSSSEYTSSEAWNQKLYYNNFYVTRGYGHKLNGYSIRCLQDDIEGCTDPEACNYNETATADDGSCEYEYDCATVNQTVQTGVGWNWFSINLESDDMSVNNVLSNLNNSEGDFIKSQGASAEYYADFGWYGSLDTINNMDMYQLEVLNGGIIAFTGYPVDPSSITIHLTDGWNWIGYVPQNAGIINDALGSIGDSGVFIKNQAASAEYYTEFGWFGSLDYMAPGDGYQLQIIGEADLVYPNFEADDGLTRTMEVKEMPESITEWVVNPHAYEFNGAITLSVDNRQDSPGDYIAAFVGGECRGVAEYRDFPFDDVDEGIYIIMSYSNMDKEEEITFKYYNGEEEVIEYTESLEFTLDMVVGNGFQPFSLSREFIIPTEFSLSAAYPNPFNPVTTLSFAIPVDSEVSLSVYNLQGREVTTLINGNLKAGYHSVVWDANSYASGVYFVKMVAGEFVNTQKLMLVK